ncbi:zinc finger protein SNAI3 [Alligator mississippiensis]|uniref:Zinc finger protein SNAI3 n=1 Tax=Alligator mississippiensis TaxID=8496 RepID=A0A151NKN8_ALLMI|nr:zinc finger protein SNAI3 [Alligator mississippiensis]
MPRSFLVKKASSTRVPDYGQLHSRAHEVIGSGSGWRPSSGGQALPAPLQTEDAPPSAPCEAARLWDRGALLARLSLPLPLEGEAKGTPGPSPSSPDVSPADTPTGTPLRDNQNDLNRLSLPRRRVPELGSPAEGSKATPDKLVGAPGETPPRLGCCDCRASYPAVCRHRELPPRKSFACKHCDKEYASLGALKMHIRTHTLPCLCKICGKAFSRPWLLQGHIRTHTGEKPYSCSHCSRAFADRSNLRAHLQTHSDVKKYQCRACAKTFSRMSLLARHEEAGCCPAS